MKTRVEATLGGVKFSDLHQKLILQAVEEAAPNWNIAATSTASQYGQRIGTFEKRYRDITIRFAVNEIHNLTEREDILQAVRDWAAAGGWLELSYKQGKRIFVTVQAMPAQTGITKWAENYSLVFRAWGMPEWESSEAASVSARGTTGTARLNVPASGGGLMRIEAVNNTGTTCNVISVTAGGQQMTFAGLGLAGGQTFRLEYDESNGYLQKITVGNVSMISARSTDSADDFKLPSGETAISFQSAVALEWRFYCYGRWNG